MLRVKLLLGLFLLVSTWQTSSPPRAPNVNRSTSAEVAGSIDESRPTVSYDADMMAAPSSQQLDSTQLLNAPAPVVSRYGEVDARRVLEALGNPDSLHRLNSIARLGAEIQAKALGIALDASSPTTKIYVDSDPLVQIIRRSGFVHPSILRFVYAYLNYESAARQAFSPVRAPIHPPLGGSSEESDSWILQLNDEEMMSVLQARTVLIAAAADLQLALDRGSLDGQASLEVPPLVSIDLTEEDDIYTQDFALLIDAGGSDRYLNNAGGSNLSSADGCGGGPITELRRASSALIDFGGNDRYEGEWSCGANGGGDGGGGFLFDASGDDVYLAGGNGVNGGAAGGAGVLIDRSGSDVYSGASGGVNGGGWRGIGFLFDEGGNDIFHSAALGVNGGGAWVGSGFLVDAGGNDHYYSYGGAPSYYQGYPTNGANGGGSGKTGIEGVGLYIVAPVPTVRRGGGFLADGQGDDVYAAKGPGVNGGATGLSYLVPSYVTPYGYVVGSLGASGLLVDREGNDRYFANESFGFNGGGYAGPALLLDLEGCDAYGTKESFWTDENWAYDQTLLPSGTGAQIDHAVRPCGS